jgi:hypothetical protein
VAPEADAPFVAVQAAVVVAVGSCEGTIGSESLQLGTPAKSETVPATE